MKKSFCSKLHTFLIPQTKYAYLKIINQIDVGDDVEPANQRLRQCTIEKTRKQYDHNGRTQHQIPVRHNIVIINMVGEKVASKYDRDFA